MHAVLLHDGGAYILLSLLKQKGQCWIVGSHCWPRHSTQLYFELVCFLLGAAVQGCCLALPDSGELCEHAVLLHWEQAAVGRRELADVPGLIGPFRRHCVHGGAQVSGSNFLKWCTFEVSEVQLENDCSAVYNASNYFLKHSWNF